MIRLIESQTIELKQIWKDEYLKLFVYFQNLSKAGFIENWGKGSKKTGGYVVK